MKTLIINIKSYTRCKNLCYWITLVKRDFWQVRGGLFMAFVVEELDSDAVSSGLPVHKVPGLFEVSQN